MNLTLQREPSDFACTISQLYIDGVPSVFILEDVARTIKIHGQTAIPAGRYPIVITMSPRFGKPLPLLLGVPGFEGVRIHSGNTSSQTEGCLLPGLTRTGDSVGDSRVAFNSLFAKIQGAINRHEPVTITIKDAA